MAKVAGGIIDFMVAASQDKDLADTFHAIVTGGTYGKISRGSYNGKTGVEAAEQFFVDKGYTHVERGVIHTILRHKDIYKGNKELDNPVVPMY